MIKTQIPIQNLRSQYVDQKLSVSHISKLYDVSDYYIRKLLLKNNIQIRKNNKYSYGFNEKFFHIPNILNSYWSGFIAADGCIYKTKNQDCLQLFISYKDVDHLYRFKECIKYSGDIKVTYRKNSGNRLAGCKRASSKMCRINIFSNNLCKDLFNNYNIIPRKSLILCPPSKLSDHDIMAYIAGLIDGDGCIAKNKKYHSIYILGTKKVLEWCLLNINRITGEQNNISIKKPKGKKLYRMVLSKKRTLIKIYNEIVCLNIPIMSRKWDKLIYLKTS